MTNEQNGQVAEKSKTSAVEFIHETQREIAKVTWPTRKEIMMTTVLIVIFAIITGVFFLVVDGVLGFAISRLLGMQS
jgi:preprotein translocase subunit SecE